MGTYDGLFKDVEACGESSGGLITLDDLGGDKAEGLQFPSLDALHESCQAIPQSRDFIKGVEYLFSNRNQPTRSWDVADLLRFPDNAFFDVLAWFINSAAIIGIYFVLPIAIAFFVIKRTDSKKLGILVGALVALIICWISVSSPNFNGVKDELRYFLDPITEPLSWGLIAALDVFEGTPWYFMIPALILLSYYLSRSVGVTAFVAFTLCFYAFVDIYDHAMQTLAIVLLCTFVCVLIGVPVGIAMSKRDWLRDLTIPILDLLQTLPSFVYLVPLILLFSATAPKLYGIAIILYAIVPVIRLTNLGIRLVDQEVVEAANAFGMTPRQKLFKVEIPLALPNIMAGVNQTVMMSLAMVVIASMVSAPGLGKYVLRAIRNVEIGYGIVYGLAIVLMAVCLDRVSKAALNRINVTQ